MSPGRTRLVMWLGLGLAACIFPPACTYTGCSLGPAPAFPFDAGPPNDSGRDVGTDAAGIPPAVTLTVIDGRPCVPLEALVPRRRVLPTDATPRLLWSTRVGGLLEDSHAVGAADRAGNVHVTAQGAGTLTTFMLGADGTLFGSERIPSTARALALLTMPDTRSLTQLNDQILHAPSPPSSGTSLVTRTGELLGLAASRNGFYASHTHYTLSAFCLDGPLRAPRLRWELHGPLPQPLHVEADDSLWLNGGVATGGRLIHIASDGTMLEFGTLPDGTPVQAIQFAGDTTFLTRALPTGELATSAVREGAMRYSVGSRELPVADPTGALWVDGRRYVNGLVEPGTSVPSAYEQVAMLEDGSWLARGPTGASLRRVHPDGRVAWEVPVSAFTALTHDVDGRVFLYGPNTIEAVQSDALPPSLRGCWQPGCGPTGDGRVAALP